MKKALLFLTLFHFAPLAHAAENSTISDRFAQANQFFEKGELEKAGEIYNALIAQGFSGTELYYNLGNWHYRRGERGKAVLWYERALRLSPRDSDIQFNLSLARSHIKEEEGNLLTRIFLSFTKNELSILLLALLWLFFGTLGARILGWFKAETWPVLTLWFSGSLLFLTGTWFGVAFALDRQPVGVVTTPPGEVRNGPGADYAVGFTIPEGSKVLILNRRPDWTQVGVEHQGLKGWMPNTDLEPVQITPALLN